MPVTLRTNPSGSTGQKKPSGKKTADTGPRQPSVALVVVVGIVVLAFIGYWFKANFFQGGGNAPTMTKVAPLPGFPDIPPYNTKEWQDAQKEGRASVISGVPPGAMGGPKSPALNGSAQQPTGPNFR